MLQTRETNPLKCVRKIVDCGSTQFRLTDFIMIIPETRQFSKAI